MTSVLVEKWVKESRAGYAIKALRKGLSYNVSMGEVNGTPDVGAVAWHSALSVPKRVRWLKRGSQEGSIAHRDLRPHAILPTNSRRRQSMTDLQYPIGRFIADTEMTEGKRRGWIEEIAGAAAMFRKAVAGLTPNQLDTPYRPGGWSVRQVVHHMADSHAHVCIRFRLALTETEPTITGYSAAAWAELADARSGPVEPSLVLLGSLHDRWVLLLRSMTPADFARTFRRPDGTVVSLDRALQSYAWHGKHHAAHITSLRERMGWK